MPDRITAGMIAVAEEWSKLFTTAKRDSGEEFTKHSAPDDSPLYDAVRDAHGSMLPDDTRYAMIRSAIDAIAEASEGSDVSDVAHEFADGEPSVYNAARARWLASHIERGAYVDEAAQEYGLPDASEFSVYDAIARGWYMEALEVFNSIAESIEAEAEAREEAETEDA